MGTESNPHRDGSTRAKRLLRQLDLPTQAFRVLKHPKYHTEHFYLHYEEACDHELFNNPYAGFFMAKLAPALARLIDHETCFGGLRGEQRKNELIQRALCLLAGAYRRIGNLPKSETLYRQAMEVEVSELQIANLSRRLAVLRLDQGRVEEALTLVNGAIGIYRKELPELFAATLLIRGAIFLETGRFSEAILDNSAALPHINAKKNPRRFHMAIHNISHALARGASYPEDLGRAIQYLKQANRLSRTQKVSLPKLKLKWIQGLIFNKLGATRRGEVMLQAARQGLIELGAPYEVAMVSLDLSALYLLQGRYWKLSEVAEETLQTCRRLNLSKDILYPVNFWARAAQAEVLTIELISVTRDAIQNSTSSHALS